jgi:hypothetical protein
MNLVTSPGIRHSCNDKSKKAFLEYFQQSLFDVRSLAYMFIQLSE